LVVEILSSFSNDFCRKVGQRGSAHGIPLRWHVVVLVEFIGCRSWPLRLVLFGFHSLLVSLAVPLSQSASTHEALLSPAQSISDWL